jgi:hypothetical protein
MKLNVVKRFPVDTSMRINAKEVGLYTAELLCNLDIIDQKMLSYHSIHVSNMDKLHFVHVQSGVLILDAVLSCYRKPVVM